MKDKEKQIKIKRGELVDLLNQEQEELQNASAIEEMAKDIHRVCTACSGEMFDEYTCDRCQAKLLIEKGYRKLPEDSVVLSSEEYEKLKSLYDTQKDAIMTSSIGDLPLTVKGLRKAVDEITRLNRVEAELQELNIKYYNEAKDLRRELKQSHKETAKEFAEKLWNTIKDKGIDYKIGLRALGEEIDELLKEYEK